MPNKSRTDRSGVKRPKTRQANRRRWYSLAIWKRPITGLRDLQLAREPLCRECKAEGVTTAATEVDHIKDFGDSWEMFVDPANHQSMCKRHHSRKTMIGNRDKGRISGR